MRNWRILKVANMLQIKELDKTEYIFCTGSVRAFQIRGLFFFLNLKKICSQLRRMSQFSNFSVPNKMKAIEVLAKARKLKNILVQGGGTDPSRTSNGRLKSGTV
jgi:hypothetical protein